ncbi:hypothetical protein BGW80DRAFT_1330225, partial [Lactifluus volemus]
MRNVHGGRSHWFHTISVAQPIVSLSSPCHYHCSQPTDVLCAALNILTEYEHTKEENDRPKIGDYTLGMADISDTYLTIRHMVPLPARLYPSLLDILSAFYVKLAKLLAPSPFLHVSQHMLGLSHPHPGTSASAADESLWSVALGSTPIGGTAGPGAPP